MHCITKLCISRSSVISTAFWLSFHNLCLVSVNHFSYVKQVKLGQSIFTDNAVMLGFERQLESKCEVLTVYVTIFFTQLKVTGCLSQSPQTMSKGKVQLVKVIQYVTRQGDFRLEVVLHIMLQMYLYQNIKLLDIIINVLHWIMLPVIVLSCCENVNSIIENMRQTWN